MFPVLYEARWRLLSLHGAPIDTLTFECARMCLRFAESGTPYLKRDFKFGIADPTRSLAPVAFCASNAPTIQKRHN